jgi:histidinol phosphatase-like PHP family hydrolase
MESPMESLSIDSFCHVHDQKCEKIHDTYLTTSNCSFFRELTRTYPTVCTDQFINLPVINALKYGKIPLRYISPSKLKNDKEIVLAAVHQDGSSLEYASDELKNNKEVVFAAVTNDGWALRYASKELKDNREIVLAAVQQKGYALECASDELRDNREIVLAAVQQHGHALEYASDALQDDEEVSLLAEERSRYASGERY